MLSRELISLLRLVEQDKVYWTRQGGSRDYAANISRIKELVGMGLVICVPDGCCNKDFILTDAGKESLEAIVQ